MTTALKNEIKRLARESVREALREELTLLRAAQVPLVSKKEQRNIEKLYNLPSRQAVSTYYLKGKAARDLDKLAEGGLREYKAGKTRTAASISSAVKVYRKEHAR